MNLPGRRHLAIIGIAAALLGVAVTMPVVAATDLERGGGTLTVTGGEELTFAGMIPGARTATQLVEIAATDTIDYDVTVAWEGSDVLAAQMELTLTGTSGEVLYNGPVSGAADWASDGRLTDGGTETIAVDALLPITAGNEVQGTTLAIQLVVEAVGTAD